MTDRIRPPVELTPQEVKDLLARDNDVRLYDVREDWEIATASIGGAVPMTESVARELVAAGDREAKYVFFCHRGMRSLAAAEFFARQGFKQTYSMAGGIDAWSVQIDPTVPRY